jgi:hypothetical protein
MVDVLSARLKEGEGLEAEQNKATLKANEQRAPWSVRRALL